MEGIVVLLLLGLAHAVPDRARLLVELLPRRNLTVLAVKGGEGGTGQA